MNKQEFFDKIDNYLQSRKHFIDEELISIPQELQEILGNLDRFKNGTLSAYDRIVVLNNDCYHKYSVSDLIDVYRDIIKGEIIKCELTSYDIGRKQEFASFLDFLETVEVEREVENV